MSAVLQKIVDLFKRDPASSSTAEATEPASAATAEDVRRKTLGERGEAAVARLLLKKGYRILERNYLCRSGEIDIIAEKQNLLVCVEVKTRTPRSWELPEEAVSEVKQKRVMRAARHYMTGFGNPSPMRFDVASVFCDETGKVLRIEIIESAFGEEPSSG